MLAVLTAVLVVLTAYYAWQTRAMVVEMRSARQLSLQPKIALDVELIGPTFGVVVAANVGAGPALNGRLTLTFHAAEGDDEERVWVEHLVTAGERHQFLPPDDAADMTAFSDRYPTVSLRGHVRDAFGERIDVDDQIAVKEAWSKINALSMRWEEPPADRAIRELERIRGALENVAQNQQRQRLSRPLPPGSTSA